MEFFSGLRLPSYLLHKEPTMPRPSSEFDRFDTWLASVDWSDYQRDGYRLMTPTEQDDLTDKALDAVVDWDLPHFEQQLPEPISSALNWLDGPVRYTDADAATVARRMTNVLAPVLRSRGLEIASVEVDPNRSVQLDPMTGDFDCFDAAVNVSVRLHSFEGSVIEEFLEGEDFDDLADAVSQFEIEYNSDGVNLPQLTSSLGDGTIQELTDGLIENVDRLVFAFFSSDTHRIIEQAVQGMRLGDLEIRYHNAYAAPGVVAEMLHCHVELENAKTVAISTEATEKAVALEAARRALLPSRRSEEFYCESF